MVSRVATLALVAIIPCQAFAVDADLSVGVVVDAATPEEGQQVVYTVTVTNGGPSDATGVALTDLLPAGLTYVGDDAAITGTSYDSGTGVWTVGGLSNGQALVLNITASVDAGTGGSTLTNTASVSGLTETDPVPGNDSASVDVTVGVPVTADLSVGVVVDAATPEEGQQVVYTVTVTNGGPSDATGVALTDLLPAGLTYVGDDAAITGTSYDSGTGVWTVGGLSNGQALVLNITASVDAGTGGSTLTNTASVSGLTETDPVPGNDSASVDVTVGVPVTADLSVGVVVDAATPEEGQQVVYTVTVTNGGPSDATGVALTDLLPAGLTYVGDDAAITGTSYDSGTGVWTVGGLSNGQALVLNITASVDAGTGGSTLTNTASVSGLIETDPVPGNDSASVDVTVGVPVTADLSVGVVVDAATPERGQQVVYTVTVTNGGPSDATGVALTDLLPAGLTYVGDDAAITGTSYDSGTGVWTVGGLSNGQALVLNITASVDAGTGGSTLTNTASVSGLTETDPVPGNDSASVDVTVGVQASNASFQQDGGAQGVVSLEVENYHASVVAPDGHEWLSAGSVYPGHSGSDALQALPEDSVSHTTDYASLSPQLDYLVNFVATGTHYVWVRALGPTPSSNKLNVGLDGQALVTGDNMKVSFNQGYKWGNRNGGGGRLTVDIMSPGVREVNVWMRESGMVIDKVVLTTDAAYNPSTISGGLGPDESVRSTEPTAEKPRVTPNGGIFDNSVQVTLTSDTPGATIYYTLDGTDPTLSSNVYTGPFLLTVSATLKTRAFLTGFNDSAIEAALFQITPLPSGLDLYFPFDETVGSTFTDTVAGVTASCASCPTPDSGRVGGAQQYDGIDDEVNVPDVGLFDWGNITRFSVQVWLKKASTCVGSKSIVGRHEGSNQLHWWLGCENGIAAFTLIDSGGVGATILGTTNITDGQWHHLVAVNDATVGEIRLYVDGIEEAAVDIVYSADFAGVAELNIGWLNDSATDYHFSGVIDEVALHRRVLTQAEISRHYMDGVIGLQRGYWGCETPVRLMPLGDSITEATGQGGYRPKLYFDLVDAGYDVDFVGSNTDSTGIHDAHHEGHGGFTSSNSAASLNSWLTQNPPDVILLHIGTNEDPVFPYPSAGGVDDLHNIIDVFDPNISIVQSRIINRVPYESLVTQFNDNVVAMVTARVANGENITVADHESALNYIDDMNNDGIHPLQSGYDKMSPVWFEQLASFLPACNQTLPQTTSQAATSAEVGVPYEYQLETRGFPSPDYLLLAAPAGMTIHPDTGRINWTPSVTGSANVSVQVQNLAGSTTHDFTVSVSMPVTADLSVGVVVDAATPEEGQQVVYTVTVTNGGPSDATGVALTDLLPAGLTYVGDDAAITGTSYDSGTGVWTVGGLSNGQALVLNITASVDAGTGGSTLTNTASVSGLTETDPVPGNDSASVDVTVGVPVTADLSVGVVVDAATPEEGQQVVYTVTVTNGGPSDATGVALTDLLPAGLTYVGDDAAITGTSYDSGTGVWTVGGLSNGQALVLNITASVDAGTGGSTLTNTASVSGLIETDPVPGNDSASVDVTVGVPVTADLSVGVVVDAATPERGQQVVYTVTVTNGGPSDATGVALTDLLPAGLTYVGDDAAITGTSYDSGTGVWTVGGLSNGQALVLNITASVDAGTGGSTLTNTASVSGLTETDPVPGNDSASVDVTVGVPVTADLSVGVVVDAATPEEGQQVVYTVTVTNGGPSDATGVALTDLLPAGLTYVGDDAAITGTSYDSGTGVWTVGGLSNGQALVLNITASVDAGTGGSTLTNTASVSGLIETDPVPGNDSASVDVTVGVPVTADLSVGVVVDAATPEEGQQVVYTVTVTNGGPSDATGVALTDLLPAGLTYVGDDAAITGTSYDSGTGVWTVGGLSNGQALVLNITASVDAGTGGSTLTNTASVSGLTETDPVPGNDSASVNVTVGSSPSIADGDINGDGQVNAADVLLAQRIVSGLYIPTLAEFQRADVAPLIGGVPSSDSEINAGDLLLIQRKALGLVNF